MPATASAERVAPVAIPALGLLVPTKFTAPQPLESWVAREHLVARLVAAQDARLLLIVAPAGFGKSTLAMQWLAAEQQQALPAAWLTLDEHDQHGRRFLAYIAAAVEQAVPGALTTTRGLIGASEPPPLYVIIQALLVELSALPARLTLVLDDYHTVQSSVVQQSVGYMLRHLPPTCRLVLLSRVDPPLPLARLRAERQVIEIRAADLRFNADETAVLLAHLSAAEPGAALVTAVQERTEGWPIAVQLAGLVRTGAQSLDQVLRLTSRQVAEYLGDEVFDRQPVERQRLLLVLALPERFCAELCAALLGRPDDVIVAESLLEQLLADNMLLIPLDAQGRWYRFHPLFRDLLLRRLRLKGEADDMRLLHRRAADWLAQAELPMEAVPHFLAAGAEDSAASLVERQILAEMGRGASNSVVGFWLALLPEALIKRRPGLALCDVRRASLNLDLPAIEAGLARLETLLAEQQAGLTELPWPAFPADHAALIAVMLCWQGHLAEALDSIHSALEQGTRLVPPAQLAIFLGLVYAGTGRYAEGIALVGRDASSPLARLPQELARHVQSICLCGMHLHTGQLDALARDASLLLQTLSLLELGDIPASYPHYCLALAAYERDELATATVHFGAITRLKYQVNATTYMSAIVALAQIAIAQGMLEAAAGYAAEAQAVASTVGGDFLRYQALACALHLALARGETDAALYSAALIDRDVHLGFSIWFATPRLSRARALIAGGDPAQLAQAETLLAECRAEIEPLHNTRVLVAVLALQALLQDAQGTREAALATLEHAVALAAPRGFVRTFRDLGPRLEPLLHILAARGVAPTYLARLITPETAPSMPTAPLPAVVRPPQFAETLTQRETQVLALLAERWSNHEIAEQLGVTVNTIRKHISTIYDKLGVSSRREAVTAARALGLLPQQ
jgi:LuxR family transcriptional regulator, maltose regulon positive regulatory protein